jgi:hypothetical protein
MARAARAGDLLPRWTKHVVTELGGRDPLGLSRVSFNVTDTMMPGIVVNTNRARYYALYTWILWHIAQKEGLGSLQRATAAFQRREAAIAFATLLREESASVVGRLAAEKALEAGGDEVVTELRVLPANPLGGYGQYYGGSLYRLGLTSRPDGGFDRAAEGFAEQLAHCVDRTASKTPYVKDGWFSQRRVPIDVLRKSADRLSLDAITEPFAEEERQLLVTLFFAWRPEERAAPSWRRDSLTRLLHVMRSYESASIPVHVDTLDDQLLYGPTYHEMLVDEDGAPRLRYETPAPLVPCSGQWRQFCVHEYLTYALETLLSSLLELLGRSPGGLTAADAADALTGPGFIDTLETWASGPATTPYALLETLGAGRVLEQSFAVVAHARLGLESPRNEETALTLTSTALPGGAAGALALLTVLYAKWRLSEDASYNEIRRTAGNEICAPRFLALMDEWIDSRFGWTEVALGLVAYLVRHHDRIMYEKGRLESCWIEAEQDHLTRAQDYDATFRESRHSQAARILEDLLLVRRDAEEHLTLTSAGKGILRRTLGESR